MKQNKRKQKSTPAKEPTESLAAVESSTAEATPTVRPAVATHRTEGGESTFTLSASCTMREGAALKVELMKLVNEQTVVRLDVAAVERIDSSALQLLCAFVRDRRARRLTTHWQGGTQAFNEAVEILGLSQALNYTSGQSSAPRAA